MKLYHGSNMAVEKMDKNKLSGFLMIICNQILQMLMERKEVDYKKAVELLYKSQMYAKLEIEETKLWHFSAEKLYMLLDEELTTGKITYPEEQS